MKKQENRIITTLRTVLRKRKIKKQRKKHSRKLKRTARIYIIKKNVDEFMKAAFEPKSVKTARKKQQKLLRKKLKAVNAS